MDITQESRTDSLLLEAVLAQRLADAVTSANLAAYIFRGELPPAPDATPMGRRVVCGALTSLALGTIVLQPGTAAAAGERTSVATAARASNPGFFDSFTKKLIVELLLNRSQSPLDLAVRSMSALSLPSHKHLDRSSKPSQ